MIGRLRGTVITKKPPLILLDVNGVGYDIQAPMSTCYHVQDNAETILLTHLIVREDAQILYGFLTEAERELFRALIKVNGVGPKLAITILSGMEPAQFVNAIQQQDTSMLINIPGIGKKTAERLVVETRDSLKSWQQDVAHNSTALPNNNQITQDALSALTALGYKPNEANRAVQHNHQPGQTTETLIRLALQYLMTGVTS